MGSEPASPPKEPAVSSGIPGDGRPRACNRGLEASRRPVGPGPDRTRTKCLKPVGPGPRVLSPNVHRPLPRPARARPADSDGFQRSNPQLPRRRPLGPFPPSAPVEERKKERAAAAVRGPTHHDPGGGGAATQAGDALSRVASVPLPRAPQRPLYLPPPTPTPTPSARTPPARASPPPRARATPARLSEAQGRFGRPLLFAPSPSPGHAGRNARGAAGAEAGQPKQRSRAASCALLREPGFSCEAVAPPAGRAMICRLSGHCLRAAAQR